jgi:hypothetical protein
MLEQIGNPLGILSICLSARHRFDMRRIHQQDRHLPL